MGKVSFLFGFLLGKDMALVSMFPFNFSCSGQRKPFLGTGMSLNFRHSKLKLFRFIYFFAPFGDINMIIRLPSNLGSCSTFPRSSKSWANRRSNISPCSLKSIERPLKNT